MSERTDPAPPRKPRLAMLIATGFGLGYLPVAPGTWGSLLGLAVGWAARRHELESLFAHRPYVSIAGYEIDPELVWSVLLVVVIAALGCWVSDRVARHSIQRDPRQVVIDEVSGQMIALLGAGWLFDVSSDDLSGPRFVALMAPNWKYLLLGFILFRAFDIWKPFPVRQAERLPGGWGIMADDWVAGVYAALGLWLARYLGL